MKPQNTILSDFQWLMLDDRVPTSVPPELYSEPLSAHYSTVNHSETLPARLHPRAA